MEVTYSFGEWVSQRRKAFDMTQRELAAQGACAIATIKKIENDQRRPSRELAGMLARALRVPADWHETFIECARGQRPVDVLAEINLESEDLTGTAFPVSGSLPFANTPFVGRAREQTRIADMLNQSDCRLLTLTGPGGIGKTRLAVEVARAQLHHWDDGVAFVPLTPVTEAALIPTAIAHSLHLSVNDEAQLLAYLRDRHLLLILDNCEQIVDGLVWLSELLAHSPGLKLMATSREPLRLVEEWVYPLPQLGESPAITLFAQTAARRAPDFRLESQHQAVKSICELVDNLPLAIELSASWTPFMNCQEIADHIQHDIGFLAANVHNVPERHHSIRAVLDHSWRLLQQTERQVLMQLSVFRGGWAVEEAERVAGATAPMLRALMEKSLVHRTEDDRYDLHELTRQYAAEQLRAAGQEGNTCTRHAEVYIKLAKRLVGQVVSGSDAFTAFARLETELDNFCAALSWATENKQAETALRLLAELFFFWLRRGYWLESERWIRQALAADGDVDPKWTCIGLCNLATFTAIQGRYAEADPYSQQAREIANQLGDIEALIAVDTLFLQATFDLDEAGEIFAHTLSLLEKWDHPTQPGLIARAYSLYGGRLLREKDHHDQARAHLQESVTRFRQLGNNYMVGYPLGNLGRLALRDGRLQEAYDLISETVAGARQIGNRVDLADWIWQLGQIALHLGDTVQAEACFEEALALYEEIGNRQAIPDMLAYLGLAALLQDDLERSAAYLHQSLLLYQEVLLPLQSLRTDWNSHFTTAFVSSLLGTAVVASARGDHERAAILMSYVAQVHDLIDREIVANVRTSADTALTQARKQLSEEAFSHSWETGRSMSLAEILVCGLAN